MTERRPLDTVQNGCQECAIGAPFYIPCNKPASRIIGWLSRPTEGPYRMCALCAQHNVRNRGATDMGEFKIMSVVIQIISLADGSWIPYSGHYLASFDFEARGGRGEGFFTPDKSKAKVFANHGEAFSFWKTRSKTKPTRADGKPNRPMTAYSISTDSITPQSENQK